MNGRTEPLGSATIATEIHGDEPVLRPRRTIRCHAEVWTRDKRPADRPSYTVTFFEGAVWDVARITAKLELRRAHEPRRTRFSTDQRFTVDQPMLVLTRTMDRDESPAPSFVLYGDDAGRVRRTPISVVRR